MRYEYIELAERIHAESKGRVVYLFVNPGNWGDALIGFGTRSFLNYFKIPYKELYYSAKLTDKLKWLPAILSNGLLLVTGGGAFVSHFNHLAPTIKNIQKKYRFRHTIVMPSTYAGEYSLANCTFYRRDICESVQYMPDSTFCHDMAFFIDRLESPQVEENKIAYCFREDSETGKQHKIPDNNYDLSGKGTYMTPMNGFFNYISNYKIIHTDRLHVAIGGCLMGKEVHIYPGNYFKNRAIYESSIEGYYDNVYFHELFEGV